MRNLLQNLFKPANKCAYVIRTYRPYASPVVKFDFFVNQKDAFQYLQFLNSYPKPVYHESLGVEYSVKTIEVPSFLTSTEEIREWYLYQDLVS